MAAPMLVPEAPVDEDYLFPGTENKIRITRHVMSVEAISVPHAVYKMADEHFRLGVHASDAGHSLASLRVGQRIVPHHRHSGPTPEARSNSGTSFLMLVLFFVRSQRFLPADLSTTDNRILQPKSSSMC